MARSLPRPQNFANHRAFPSAPFLIAGLVLTVEAGRRLWRAISAPSLETAWLVFVPLSLLVVWYASRQCAQTVQDRVIRLEMQLRLQRLLGPARAADVARLELGQLIALRFAGDAELPGLVDQVLGGQLTTPDDIKRRVATWQADWLRV